MTAPAAKYSCNVCSAVASKTCGKCKRRFYCCAECQREDWPLHKRYCVAMSPEDVEITSLNWSFLKASFDRGEWEELVSSVRRKHGGKVELVNLKGAILEALKQQCLNDGVPKDFLRG